MPLNEFEKSEEGGEKAWENAAPHLSELAGVLKENGGPFFLGKTGPVRRFHRCRVLTVLEAP